MQCRNHPGVPATAACARCSGLFCDNCLAELLGARYCLPCRQARLVEAQGFSVAAPGGGLLGTGRVELGRWFSRGWGLISASTGTWILATLLGGLVGLATCGIGAAAVQCGLILMAYRQLAGLPVAAGDVMLGFRRFLYALLTALLLGIPAAVINGIQQGIATAAELGAGDGSGGAALVLLPLSLMLGGLSIVVGITMQTVGLFALPAVAARNVDPIAAISGSVQVVRRNPVMFALAAVSIHLVGVLGAVACCVGLLLTLPLSAATLACAYVDHYGLQDARLE
jgi:hypothetical protein